MKILGFSTIVLTFTWIASTSAGELVLNNGDRVAGELEGYLDGKLSWRSDSFGQITTTLDKVMNLTTAAVVSINDLAEACRWESIDDGMISYTCEASGEGTMPVEEVVSVAPYKPVGLEPGYDYEGKLTVTGRRASGNKEEEELEINSKTLFEIGDYRHAVGIEFESKSKDKQDGQEQLDIKYSVDWFFAEQWFLYGDAQFNYDEPKNIDERYILGTGVGYQFIKTDRTSLSIETGIDYVKENFAEPDMPTPDFVSNDERAGFRFGTDFRHILPNDIELYHTNQLIQSLEEGNDWVFETVTGMSIPLVGSLYTEIKLDYDVDNLPADTRRREDTELTVGIGYAW